MRKLICLPILFITLSFLLPGCRKETKRLAPFGWEAIGEPMDSLVLELQWFLCRNNSSFPGSTDSVARRLETLREAASLPGVNPEAKARVKFFEAIHASRNSKTKAPPASMLEEAKALSDTLLYPFLSHRVGWLYAAALRPLGYDIDFFENIEKYSRCMYEMRDTFLMAQTNVMQANFYIAMHDFDQAASQAMKADALFSHLGLTGYSYECKALVFNIALHTKNLAKADSLAKWMEINDGQAALNLRAGYYLNRYLLSSDESDLLLARKLSLRDTSSANGKIVGAPIFLGSALISAEHGDFTQAAVYDSIGMRFLNEVPPSVYVDYSTVFRQRANYLEMIGERDSAYRWICNALDINEAIMQSKDFSGALKSAVRQYQAEKEIEEQQASSKRTLWLVLAGGLLIILLGGGGVIYWRRRQQRKLRSVQEQLRFEEAQRKVLAMQLAIQEERNLIDSVGREMDQMTSEGHISTEAASRLRSSIKVHSGSDDERNNFIETFSQLHPDFASRLREACPELTDADIRLASYISLGMDSRHISRVLSIRPESVKQARWRLRQKLNLASGTSLDTYLADLLK